MLVRQIVSLGAGFDTLYFRVHEDTKKPHVVFEVDFPDLVRRKVALLRRSPELVERMGPEVEPVDVEACVKLQQQRKKKPSKDGATDKTTKGVTTEDDEPLDVLGGGVYCDHYRLVGVDMSDLELLRARLGAAGIDESLPTLFLSECVLTYMDGTSAQEVSRLSLFDNHLT